MSEEPREIQLANPTTIPCGPKAVFRRNYGLPSLSHDQYTVHAVRMQSQLCEAETPMGTGPSYARGMCVGGNT